MRRGYGGALEMGIPVGCPGLRVKSVGYFPQAIRQQVPAGCELPPNQPALPLQCIPSTPPPMLLVPYSPQPGGRASLLSHSHSSAWMWVPVSKLEAPSPGCKGTKSPCTPLASCCPSLCATPQPCLGLPERWEAQASMDLPPPPFPGLSRGQLQP